jgi:hypothetical protein
MNPTEASFEKLTSILEREYDAHEQLLGAAEGMGGAVKKSDLATLRKNTAEIDEQVSAIEALEGERLACCNELSTELGIRGNGPVRLGALIDRAPARQREKLAFLRASLRQTLRRISRNTVANRVLIEEGLLFVKGRIALVMQSGGARFAHYRAGGARAAAALPFHPFVNKTA